MLGFLKEKMKGGTDRLSGKADLLEAACAMCALVMAADGDLEDSEAETALDRLTQHETLSKAFPTTQIEAAFDKQVKRIKQGISGKLALKREVEDIKGKSTSEDREMLFCIAIDVAAADGEIEPPEMKVLRDIGVSLGGLDPTRYIG